MWHGTMNGQLLQVSSENASITTEMRVNCMAIQLINKLEDISPAVRSVSEDTDEESSDSEMLFVSKSDAGYYEA